MTAIKRPFTRPGVPRPKPNRSIGGLYRTAEHQEAGETFGGVPLHAAEDAIVAFVRLGYRVADEQIERGRHLADRLRGASARDGSEGLRDVVDGLDSLLLKLVEGGLQIVEDAANDPRHPLKRLGSAQLAAVASLLGLHPFASPGQEERGRDVRQEQAADDHGPASAALRREHQLWIRQEGDSDGRAVRVVSCELEADVPGDVVVTFFHLKRATGPLAARLTRRANKTVLGLTTKPAHAAGRWRGAVLDADRLQIGVIEIEL